MDKPMKKAIKVLKNYILKELSFGFLIVILPFMIIIGFLLDY